MAELDLCRLCAESKPDIIGIYDAEGQKLSIHDKIAKYLHIEVNIYHLSHKKFYLIHINEYFSVIFIILDCCN